MDGNCPLWLKAITFKRSSLPTVPSHMRLASRSRWEPIWEPIALDGCGRVWTAVDWEAFCSWLCGRLWTPVVTLEIYGSEGCSWTAWPQSAERFRGVIATLPRGVEFRSCCRESKADRGLTNRMTSWRTDRHASSCRAWDALRLDPRGSGHARSSTYRPRDLG